MTSEELIQRHTDDHNKLVAELSKLPASVGIFFANADTQTLFCENQPYSANMETLHILRKAWGAYELTSYYVNTGTLALAYRFENGWGAVLYCTDMEHALKAVSGGKCKLERIRKSEESLGVVCGV